ncbi:hypothetical protein BP5796_10158 [Coleophoma crateriformis]|uniref:Mitotic checkpoint regulator, MAD2B-interacting-domain-containing protein n=1 Tax=Coleophoma crateriformis TaxID=565419 RepID=A0A3D8QUE3_9HELO|nr:hypothetical protein BP5796_10158 [Coleophoma crateriformis]
MGLVDYSDSDTSDTEEAPAPVASSKISSKPAFQKVVDRSNPGKIRVSLPQSATTSNTNDDGPPAKRAKIGGGGLGGFNSFLPAPKRTGVSGSSATLGGGNTGKKGLGAGVNLKTGAAPGFSREPEPESAYEVEEIDDLPTTGRSGSGLSLPPPKSLAGNEHEQKPAEEVKLVGKPLMFKPLSVARKPAKKKKTVPSDGNPPSQASAPATPQAKAVEKPALRAKVSLFSMSAESSVATPSSTKGDYEPLIYTPQETREADDLEPISYAPTYEEFTPTTTQYNTPPPFVPTPPISQNLSLSDIAGDLNLSAAERRQLFGRGSGAARNGQSSAAKIINFNTDQEYLHNERLRASGEQVVHNPVRAIAPGKHSLKQLVNAAQTQKEALEESFAKGKNNRAEASSRYGW